LVAARRHRRSSRSMTSVAHKKPRFVRRGHHRDFADYREFEFIPMTGTVTHCARRSNRCAIAKSQPHRVRDEQCAALATINTDASIRALEALPKHTRLADRPMVSPLPNTSLTCSSNNFGASDSGAVTARERTLLSVMLNSVAFFNNRQVSTQGGCPSRDRKEAAAKVDQIVNASAALMGRLHCGSPQCVRAQLPRRLHGCGASPTRRSRSRSL
jgi:hypothetical protein